MQTKEQRKEEESLIFGIRPIIETINAGKEIDKLLVQSGLKSELVSQLMSLLKQKRSMMFIITQWELWMGWKN